MQKQAEFRATLCSTKRGSDVAIDWEKIAESTALAEKPSSAPGAVDWEKMAHGIGVAPKSKPRASTGEYLGNSAKAGFADAVGGVLDVGPRLLNLGKAAVGISRIPEIMGAVTSRPTSDFLPEVDMNNANMFTNMIKRAMGVDEAMVARDDATRYAGAALRGGVGGAMGGGYGLAALKGLLIGVAAGVGGEGGADISEGLGGSRGLGQILGGLASGVGAASSGGVLGTGSRVPTVLDQMQARARDPASVEQAAQAAGNIINSRMRASMQNSHGAAQNIDEGLALRKAIPGFNPSVAEMSQAPGALELQRNFARSSPGALNAEFERIKASEQALRDHYAKIAPQGGQASNVRSTLNESLAKESADQLAGAQGVAKKLPTTDLVAAGTRASAIADAEKAAARPGIAAAYGKAYDLAPESAIPAQPILTKIEEILGTPLAQIKPETAPKTFDAIKRFLGDVDEAKGMQADMNALGAPRAAPKQTMTLAEAHDLRKAVNADSTMAARSADPLAATRARNLTQMRGVIDEAIEGSPIATAAKDALKAADAKYKTEFVPRFSEGTNRLMFKDGVNNEPRIIADKFVDSYFKSDRDGGGTRAENFKQLFGKNSEARDLTKEGILDRFRTAAVNPETGVLDSGKAAAFIRDHERTLNSFKANGVNAVDDIKGFAQQAVKQERLRGKTEELARSLKFDYADDMVTKALGDKLVMDNVRQRLTPETRDTFTRMVMDKSMEKGTGAGITQFMDDHANTINRLLLKEHQSALRDIAKGMTMLELSPVKGLAQSGTDPLKNATGVSMATVWSQWRATTGGRQGAATAGFNLAAPMVTRLSQTRFNDVMETALHDPKTAEALSAFLKSTSQPAATNWATKMLSAMKSAGSTAWQSKGAIGEVALGLSNYPANLKRAIPAINTQVQSEQ